MMMGKTSSVNLSLWHLGFRPLRCSHWAVPEISARAESWIAYDGEIDVYCSLNWEGCIAIEHCCQFV